MFFVILHLNTWTFHLTCALLPISNAHIYAKINSGLGAFFFPPLGFKSLVLHIPLNNVLQRRFLYEVTHYSLDETRC